MAYLVLARKYRPQTFDELVGQESIARILKNAIGQSKVAHAYIFSGPRGVGKTSSARILAKALNCEQGPTPEPCGICPSCLAVADGSSVDVSEIDGASNTGIDNIRDLRERIRYAPSGARNKVYIIDEAHMLSTAAFNGLLKTLEEPPSHVVFVLATTEPRKIPATVLSRCQHLPFKRVTRHDIKGRLRAICQQEGFAAADAALDMISRAAEGSIRDSLTILDQIVSFSDEITVPALQDLLGATDIETLRQLLSAVITGDRKTIVLIIKALTDAGTDLKAFTKDLVPFLRNALIAKITGETLEVIDVTEEEVGAITSLTASTSEEHLALLLSELVKSESAMRNTAHPSIALEMALIRLSLLSHFTSIGEALKSFRPQAPPSQGDDLTRRSPRPRSRLPQESPGGLPSNIQETSPVKEGLAVHPTHHTRAKAAPVEMPLEHVWDASLTRIEQTNRPLASKLREGTPSFIDNRITLTFNGGLAIHADSVKESVALVKQVVKEVAGRMLPIKIETAQGTTVTKKDLKEKALNDPLVREALELFEGRIVDVTPLQDKGGDRV